MATPIRPFNMITLGDSIMWGQGLPDNMNVKFRDMVQNWLQSQFGNTRTVMQWLTHAHSGAVTGWGMYPSDTNGNDPDSWYQSQRTGYPYPGEVPFGYPSISFQIGMTVNDLKSGGVDPANVDLVLLDGGINDLSVKNILNVTLMEGLNGPNWVRTKTNQLCVAHMTNLLPQVTSQFPNAVVVMTGYFPIVSSSTGLLLLNEYLAILGVPLSIGGALSQLGPDALATLGTIMSVGAAVSPGLRAALADRSQAFAQTAFNGLTDLVNQTNQGLATTRVALAWPNFGDDNCYGAPSSYLFSAGQFLADEVRGARWQPPPGDWKTSQGVAYYRGEECSKDDPSDPLCYDACIGHPNPLGAQAYANAIIGQLQNTFWARLGLPAPPPPPRNMIASVVESGTQILTGRFGAETWNWIVVSARDSQTGAPVKGATVSMPNSVLLLQPGPAGLDYNNGPLGQKIYYICRPRVVVPGKSGSEQAGGPGPNPAVIPCGGTVIAPGYNLAGFNAPSTPL